MSVSLNKNNAKFAKYSKSIIVPVQNGLQRFSNNILIKSLVSGFVSAMPIVLVSSFFILIYAIPEAISDYLASGLNHTFNGFKAFAVRAYQFTYGILGLVVTGNIARAMMEELNNRLPFNKKVKTFNVLITAMIAYFIMSAIPVFGSDAGLIPGDPAKDSWFSGIIWDQMGAQGILPGIVIGLTTPWIFYFCYKWNITIRMPKAVPGVISQSFLSIIPFAINVLFWSAISYLFIATLGQPFIPWFFAQLSGFIPQLQHNGQVITLDQFKALGNTEAGIVEQKLIAQGALNSFSNSYGMIVLFRFLETFSWFMGVHPEAIQGVFESIMAINQEMNLVFASSNINDSFAFVNSLMGPTGNMGGTGSTFVVPIICLLFCRSTQSKVAGKSSIIPVAFQVNEPILFGQPIVLNPYFLFPFIFVPMMNSVVAKLFVDYFGLQAASIDLPWAIPWFIRGPIAQFGQPMVFLLLLINFLTAFFVYLPFVLMYDKSLVKLEIEKVGKEHFISMNGMQYQLNKFLSYDNNSYKTYKHDKKELSSVRETMSIDQYEIAKIELLNTYNTLTINNLYKIFLKIQSSKIIKANEKYNEKVLSVTEQLDKNVEKMNSYNNKIDAKILRIKEKEEILEKSYSTKINEILNKKKTNPKTFVLKDDFAVDHEILLKKIDLDYEIRKNIILRKRSKLNDEKQKYLENIKNLKAEFNKFKQDSKNSHNESLTKINESLAIYKNPYKLVNVDEDVKDVGILAEDNETNIKDLKNLNVLVLCIGAGTSAMLASAINDGAKTISTHSIKASALAYDSYKEALEGVDLIITSPQLGAYLSTIQADAKPYNIKVVPTKGKQYIDLSNNSKEAANFVISQFDVATSSDDKQKGMKNGKL
ncbi:MAG: PTS transporter subunit EIIC [Malacoplasma sp.]